MYQAKQESSTLRKKEIAILIILCVEIYITFWLDCITLLSQTNKN